MAKSFEPSQPEQDYKYKSQFSVTDLHFDPAKISDCHLHNTSNILNGIIFIQIQFNTTLFAFGRYCFFCQSITHAFLNVKIKGRES